MKRSLEDIPQPQLLIEVTSSACREGQSTYMYNVHVVQEIRVNQSVQS